jgi:hypothetical protein
MHARCALAAVLVLALSTAARADTPQTGRLWFYAGATGQLAPSWSFSIIPGIRFEYERTGAAAKGHYLDEVFVGPNWSKRWGLVNLKLSGWYYFLGYPRPGSYPLSHNLEIIPTVEVDLSPFVLSYRAIFHNTLYASVYPTSQRWGWGMVMRNLFQARFNVTHDLGVILGDEPWFGLFSVTDAPPSSAGYWPTGLRLNRVYVGLDWRIVAGLSVSPQYVFETTIADNKVTEMGHYVFMTLSYTFKVY